MQRGNKSIVRRVIQHEDYLKTQFETDQKYVEFDKFKSKNHNLLTVTMKKLFLDNKDDKRVNLDTVNTLAIGHYKLRKEGEKVRVEGKEG